MIYSIKKGWFKYFNGYINQNDAFSVPLRIKLRQMKGYVKYFDNHNIYMDVLVHDKELLKSTTKYEIRLVIW